MAARGGEGRFVIGIAGGSGSGKTTLARRLISECGRAGIPGQIFSLDSYYRPLDGLPLPRRRTYNFDHPDALDLALMRRQLGDLLAGRTIRQPVYDFRRYARARRTILRRPTPLVVVEGLYALYFPELLARYDCRVFVSTGIATAILRRVERDLVERGRDVAGAKRQILSTVIPMYESCVKPTQRNAHFSVNWDGEQLPLQAAEGLVRMARERLRRG